MLVHSVRALRIAVMVLDNIWVHTFQANFMAYYVKWKSKLDQDGTLNLQGETCGLHILVVIKVVLCGVKNFKGFNFSKDTP